MSKLKYKVGDKVLIKSLGWYYENKDIIGQIDTGYAIFDSEMAEYCGRIVTISLVNEHYYDIVEDDEHWCWTDEMIEGPSTSKYNEGDFIGVYGYETDVRIEEVRWGGSSYSYKVYLADKEEWLYDDDIAYKKDEMIEGLVEEEDLIPKFGEYSDNEPLDIPTMTTEFVKEHGLPCPDGYIFKDENGNVINATKIVLGKKKKEYPKTYEECYQITGLSKTSDIYGYKNGLLFEFQKLLIARDAYWEIAGEEMGLGKPWEPDWKNSEERRYCIVNIEGDINLPETTLTKWILKVTNKILVFPTIEMRDAFYENFKELIEQCKELL